MPTLATPRRVYFGFHFQRDIMRVKQVTNHWVTKGTQEAAGYFDGSLTEKARTEGEIAVRRLIDQGLSGSSVLCVLIGAETYMREWVDYEIFRSVELGKGVFGVYIHLLKDPRTGVDAAGPNPFKFLGYGSREADDRMVPYVLSGGGWKRPAP